MYKTVVDQIIIGDNKQINGLHYKKYTDINVPAKSGVTMEGILGDSDTIFVLAAHAIENAKILLNSPWNQITSANSSRLVGKYLMDHPMLLAWGMLPLDKAQIFPYRGPLSTSGIENLRDGSFRSSRAAWRVEIGNEGWNWPIGDPFTSANDYIDKTNKSGTNKDNALYLGSAFIAKLNNVLTRQFRIGFLVEQPAQISNHVTLSSTYTDNLGIPRPRIQYSIDDYTGAGFQSALEASKSIMDLLDVQSDMQFFSIENQSDPHFTYGDTMYNYSGAGHLCGTHIMGDTAQNSVVDSYQKSWDHDNLYLVGCGSHPTVGTQNPTLTMLAMVFRTSRQILARL